MSKLHGKNTVVFLDGFDLSGDSNSIEPNVQVDEADVASFGDDSHHSILGLDGGQVAHNAWFNDGTPSGMHAVISARVGQAKVFGCAFNDERGGFGFAGSANIISYQPTSPIGNAVAVTNQLTAQGPIDPVTVLSAKGNITGSTTPRDDGASSSGGLRAYLQLFEVLGGTPDVAVLHGTAAAGPWTALGTFSINAQGAALLAVEGTVNRYLCGSVESGSATVWLATRRL